MLFLAFRGQIGKERGLRKDTSKRDAESRKEGRAEGREGKGREGERVTGEKGKKTDKRGERREPIQ